VVIDSRGTFFDAAPPCCMAFYDALVMQKVTCNFRRAAKRNLRMPPKAQSKLLNGRGEREKLQIAF
jgi:hypothetical protein